ncbi:MAG TPA: multidrug efflux RND transporter permease subunit [Verrucomicrobiae bacterium]|jgi:multidrug efflux pump|nr:multidrug efflux RND transporter permease subunit [Verrucomicrobiae bacterium]
MKFAHFFIGRPIFASVLSIVIVLIGLLAVVRLPVAEYPPVVPPTVVVKATYPGANPQVIADTVATPIEEEVNGVEDMLYMSAQCASDGSMTLTITFKIGTDLDKAQVLVQNRVAVAEATLPEEVRRLGVTTAKQSPDITLVVNLFSPDGRYDQVYVSNYAFLRVKDALARLPGVGSIIIFGARDYSMRIWLNPEKIAARNLTADDVINAIREQNVQVAAGQIGQPPIGPGLSFQYILNAEGRLTDARQFGDIVLKSGADGQVTRLRDVARVELAALDYSMNSKLDGKPTASVAIFQLPGSNSIKTSDAVHEAMETLKKSFPPGLEYRIVFDTTGFTRESIRAVLHTLGEAMILVVLVVLLFLQTWRASVIPLLAVPVSLIGTFAAMAASGFSLNNLSLFGLVLAIGIVVDDAIVVVENVERNIALGLPPREATAKAMDEVSGAVIAVALVLCAVFIPTAFITGVSGQFYRQFALTIAFSTLISAFNSLTLSPALCAILLQPHGARHDLFSRIMDRTVGKFFAGFNRLFGAATNSYSRAIRGLIRVSAVVIVIYLGLIGLTWFGFKKVPTGFIPPQDKGYLVVAVQLPDSASLERTDAIVDRLSKIVSETPGVKASIDLAGLSPISLSASPNAGTVFVILDDFQKRTPKGLTGDVIANELRKRLAGIQEGFVGVFSPPPVNGMGVVGGFKMELQDRGGAGLQALQAAAMQLMVEANKLGTVTVAYPTFRASTPQLYLDVDRIKAKSMGVPLSDIFDTLQIYLGSLYVNDLNLFGRTYHVTAQADQAFRREPRDILDLKTRNSQGQMVPLGTLVNVQSVTGPDHIVRYDMYPAAEITGNPGPGVSTGEAISAMEKVAREKLPSSIGFEWTELTLQEILEGDTAKFVFPLCVLFVFLTLAALFESWSMPLAIILIVPMCLLFAIAGIWVRGMDNNIFTQIGFVVLVGLACKNAILIVEFARQRQDAGLTRGEAAIEASRLRLRPILMTSFAFIFGVVPLLLAEGAGAEMRRALGTAVFSGMLGVTLFGIFLTPIFYYVIRRVTDRKKA